MWAGFFIFGDDSLRLGGDVLIVSVSVVLIAVCNVLFVGRRKVTAAAAPAPALDHAPAPTEGSDGTSSQDDSAGKGGDQPKKGGDSQLILLSLFIIFKYLYTPVCTVS